MPPNEEKSLLIDSIEIFFTFTIALFIFINVFFGEEILWNKKSFFILQGRRRKAVLKN